MMATVQFLVDHFDLLFRGISVVAVVVGLPLLAWAAARIGVAS